MNKTKDGRYIEKRVKIDKNLLAIIIKDIKQRYNLNWNGLSDKLSISSYSMRRGWLKEENTIPYSIFLKIMGLHPNLTFNQISNKIKILKPFWGQKLENTSHLEKTIKLPSLESKKFAEFYGCMLGDGCIFSNLSGICISGHSILDKDYLENYMCSIIHSLFGIKPKFYYSKTQKSLRCIVYSKKLALFLKNLGFPIGEKIKQKVSIPPQFLNNKILIKNCIKGIMDTDGSLYPHKNVKIIIDITIKNKYLLKSYLRAFNTINMDVKHTKDRIYMCGSTKCKRYFNEVGSSNHSYLLKYNTFIEKDFVPKTRDIENYLKRNKGLKCMRAGSLVAKSSN